MPLLEQFNRHLLLLPTHSCTSTISVNKATFSIMPPTQKLKRVAYILTSISIYAIMLWGMGCEKGDWLLTTEASKNPQKSILRYVLIISMKNLLKTCQRRSHVHVYAHGSSIAVLSSDSVGLYIPWSIACLFAALMNCYIVVNGYVVSLPGLIYIFQSGYQSQVFSGQSSPLFGVSLHSVHAVMYSAVLYTCYTRTFIWTAMLIPDGI